MTSFDNMLFELKMSKAAFATYSGVSKNTVYGWGDNAPPLALALAKLMLKVKSLAGEFK